MITAFFTLVSVAFFVSIATSVALNVAALHAQA